MNKRVWIYILQFFVELTTIGWLILGAAGMLFCLAFDYEPEMPYFNQEQFIKNAIELFIIYLVLAFVAITTRLAFFRILKKLPLNFFHIIGLLGYPILLYIDFVFALNL